MTVANTDGLEAAVTQRPTGTPQDSFGAWMETNKPAFARALGSKVDADQFAVFALTACRANPDLLTCTPDSMLSALMVSAQIGLTPGPFGYVYLTPRWSSKMNRNQVQFSIGYKGFVELARRTGEVKELYAHVVYSKDAFHVEYGLHRNLHHVPTMDPDRGEVVGSYAVVHYVNGGSEFVYLTKADIDKRRAAAGKGGERGPWVSHYEAMARKSAVRDLANFLPLTPDVQAAVALDDQVQSNPGAALHERQPAPFDEEAFAEGQRAIAAEPASTEQPYEADPVTGVVAPGPDDAADEAPTPRGRSRKAGGSTGAGSGASEAPGAAGGPSDGPAWPPTAVPGEGLPS